MTMSAFIVRVLEAEACVASLRERFDASSKLGVPAHITILVPFMSPERIDADVLAQAQVAFSKTQAFSFCLRTVQRFPATVYLAPEPATPFISLTESLTREFPEYPAYGGQFASTVPHLTVAHGDEQEARCAFEELEAAMQARGPVHASCSAVVLLENSSGLWKQMHTFALLSNDGVNRSRGA